MGSHCLSAPPRPSFPPPLVLHYFLASANESLVMSIPSHSGLFNLQVLLVSSTGFDGWGSSKDQTKDK